MISQAIVLPGVLYATVITIPADRWQADLRAVGASVDHGEDSKPGSGGEALRDQRVVELLVLVLVEELACTGWYLLPRKVARS